MQTDKRQTDRLTKWHHAQPLEPISTQYKNTHTIENYRQAFKNTVYCVAGGYQAINQIDQTTQHCLDCNYV